MKYNLFIVSSPLQIMNAIEAVEHFKTQNNILLLLSSENKNQLIQMNHLIKFMDWLRIEYVSTLSYKGINRLFFTRVITRQFKYIKNYEIDKLFVGDYRSEHLNHMVNYFGNNDVYLLDDGLNQLGYSKYLQNQSYKFKIRRLIYGLFFYNLSKIKYTIFSIFTIENEKTIKNNYTFFKKYINTKVMEKEVYFIGQPLVELNIIDEKCFKKELIKIINFYSKNLFIYILHRKENEEKINKLSKELNFEYKKFNNIIELEMINSDKIPSDIATFYSTAIITLPSFIKDPIYRTFKIKSEYIDKSFIPIIENIYKEFEHRKIEIKLL